MTGIELIALITMIVTLLSMIVGVVYRFSKHSYKIGELEKDIEVLNNRSEKNTDRIDNKQDINENNINKLTTDIELIKQSQINISNQLMNLIEKQDNRIMMLEQSQMDFRDFMIKHSECYFSGKSIQDLKKEIND